MGTYDGSVVIGVDMDTDPAQKSVQSLRDKLKGSIAAAAKAATVALGVATAAVTAFAKSSIDTGMQFDSAMSQVAATMGKTTDEIGELRDFAMEMGANTAFSATQAADALNYMALAGYDAEQSMEALPNVLNLAAAGGIDLAAASDMVTDAQSALGLSMEESAALVDKMAMASSKSNTSVAQLGDAILTIGGTAKNLAGGTTELSTALGILADNGVKGAEGGTALRNIILSLSAPTDTAAKAMQSLGLEVYDAQGNMRPLNETFGDLQAALSSMTQGEQTQALSKIFNKEDLKSVNALLANTGERFDELSGYIGNAAGAAENMANTQLDNLAGDVTLFKSALEGAQIILSDQLTPNLREFVQFGSDGISKIASAFQEGGLPGAMEAFGAVLSDGLNMIVEQLPAMVDAGMQLLGALGQGIIDNLPTITNAATEIIMTLVNGAIEALPEIVSSAAEIITTLASGISESLPELIPTVVDVILQIVETLIDNVDQLIDAAIEIIMALADGLIEALPKLIEKAPVIIEKFVMAIANNLPKIIEAGYDLLLKLIGGILKAIPGLVKASYEIIGAFQAGIISYFGKLLETGKEIVGKVGDGIKSIASGAAQWGKDLIDNFVGGIKNAIGKVKDAVVGVASTVKDFLGFSEPDKGPLSNFHTYGPDMVELFANGIEKSKSLAVHAARDMAQSVANAATIPAVQIPAMKGIAIPEITSFSIPAIAQGAVVPANPQFSSTVNRQTDTGSIAEQLSAIMQALQSTQASQPINITVESKLDGKVVARNTVHHINDMTRQAGKPVLLI